MAKANKALIAAREKTEYTQRQVAESAKISVVSYQRIEYGTQRPSLPTAIAIARKVKSSVEKLFGADTPTSTE